MADNILGISENHIISKGCRETFLPLQSCRADILRENGVCLGGISQLVFPYEMSRACPGNHIILCTLGGDALLLNAAGELRMSKGTTVILPTRQPHRYYIEEGKNWHLAWLHLEDCACWHGINSLRGGHVLREDYTGMVSGMQGYITEAVSAMALASAAAQAFATLLAVELQRLVSGVVGEDRSHSSRLLDLLWKDVLEDPAYPWSAEELAARVFCSRGHLHRLVRQYHNCSPMEIVRRIRLEKARSLILSTSCSLEQLAPLCGYSTAFSLSKAFKKQFGYSPRS